MKQDFYQLITSNIMHPNQLEALFRDSPIEFASAFEKVYEDNPGSQILDVWKARLDYKSVKTRKKNLYNSRLVIALLILFGGLFMQLPVSMEWISNSEYFLGTFIPVITVLSLSLYFILTEKLQWKVLILTILMIAINGVYLNLAIRAEVNDNQVPMLIVLHSGFLLWAIVGFAFLGKDYRSSVSRAEFLSLTGEMMIYGAIISTCFMILGALFGVLFDALKIALTDVVYQHIYLFLFPATALISAAFATSNFGIRKMTPYLAKIFSPLVLIAMILFLFAMIFSPDNPYENRDFLLAFNVVLIVVLAILFFVISERRGRGEPNIFDKINLLLAFVASIVDLIALSAIIYRLALYQITPNRLAVIGANVIILINLIGIIIHYFKFIRNRAPITDSIGWLGKYLPIYALWFAIVIFLFPLFFGMSQ